MQTHPSPSPFFPLSRVNMSGLELPTLPVNAAAPQTEQSCPQRRPPPAPRCRTILGLGVSGRDVPSPACLSPGIRRTGTSMVSLWPAMEGRDKMVGSPSCLCPPGLRQGPPICWDLETSSLPGVQRSSGSSQGWDPRTRTQGGRHPHAWLRVQRGTPDRGQPRRQQKSPGSETRCVPERKHSRDRVLLRLAPCLSIFSFLL